MDDLSIPATERAPAVAFSTAEGRLRLSGESYPEDAAAFFGPVQQAVEAWMAGEPTTPFTVEVALSYFNSSSAKALMNLFMRVEDFAETGHEVLIRWIYEAGDDTILEAGEDFASDFNHGRFELVEVQPA